MSGAAVVHLMRHGETARPGRLLGHTDCPATDAGIAACVWAATALSFDTLRSSDLVRARACADAIGAERDMPVDADPRWRELDFGAWDGRGTGEIDAAALAAFWRDPDASPPPGGERWSAIVARAAAALDACDDGTLVVTHGGAMRAALAAACGFDARQAWAFDLPCAATLTLRLWRGEPPAAQIVRLA